MDNTKSIAVELETGEREQEETEEEMEARVLLEEAMEEDYSSASNED